MKYTELDIQGCFLFELPVFKDVRGSFTKTYHPNHFKDTPVEKFTLAEEFYSVSKKNVLRGLHFQEPPAAHGKIVTCLDGRVCDFFVDLRRHTKTFGQLVNIELCSENPQLLYLPKGIAHGFLTLSDTATMLYKTDHVYTQELDKGIHWSSVGLKIGINAPLVSDRDDSFPTLEEYESKF